MTVSTSGMRRLLPDNSPRSLTLASLFGAASSSCSYARMAIHVRTPRSRSAFPMTDTELSAIAALAIIGLRRMPSHG
ncbi:hypothetical protein V4C53_04295 [Paraburkholderia azotifigens]|uniref:hypothetical protein n=1 Tax=Paraburkholderia azotifigens TaxID=2057004 RepID=UPI00317A4A21